MDNPKTYGGVPAPTVDVSASVKIDDSKSSAQYANFCHLSGMPEELLIEYGLNPLPMAAQPVVLARRVVVGWHTAKRLLSVLQICVDRHESAFGSIETDVQKRIRHN